jgi:flagellar basal body rod protein FlgC
VGIFLAASNSRAAISKGECLSVVGLRLKIAAHTSNLLNASAASLNAKKLYKKKAVHCTTQKCTVQTAGDKKRVYEPGHPHADRRGYVHYPDIDVLEEFSKLNKAALEMKDLAENKDCDLEMTEDINRSGEKTVSIKYKKSSVIMDVFKLSKSNSIVTWLREYTSGKKEAFDLASRFNDKKNLHSPLL